MAKITLDWILYWICRLGPFGRDLKFFFLYSHNFFFSLEQLQFSQDSCFSRQQQITGKASQKNKWHKKIQTPDKNKYINTNFPRCKRNKVEKRPRFCLITPYSPLFQAELNPCCHLGIVHALSATGQMYKQYSGKWKAFKVKVPLKFIVK